MFHIRKILHEIELISNIEALYYFIGTFFLLIEADLLLLFMNNFSLSFRVLVTLQLHEHYLNCAGNAILRKLLHCLLE